MAKTVMTDEHTTALAGALHLPRVGRRVGSAGLSGVVGVEQAEAGPETDTGLDSCPPVAIDLERDLAAPKIEFVPVAADSVLTTSNAGWDSTLADGPRSCSLIQVTPVIWDDRAW